MEYLISEAEDTKKTHENIMCGSENVYAVNVANWESSHQIDMLVKHPTINNLIHKKIDVDILQEEYKDMINEMIVDYNDSINPEQWLFCLNTNIKPIIKQDTFFKLKHYFNKGKTISLTRCLLSAHDTENIKTIRVTIIPRGEYNNLYNMHCPLQDVEFKFHMLLSSATIDDNNYKYFHITEEALSDLCHKTELKSWKEKAVIIFLNNFSVSNKPIYPNDDINDPCFLQYQKNRCCYNYPVYVYVPMEKEYAYIPNEEQLEVSAVGYHRKLNTFYGLILLPDGRRSYEEVDEEWIIANDWGKWYDTNDIIQLIKDTTANSHPKFLKCGWGFLRMNNLTDDDYNKRMRRLYHNQSTPCLKYHEPEEQTCAFTSLGSVLHYIGFPNEANHIYHLKNTFPPMRPGYKFNILEYLLQNLATNANFYNFRKEGYKMQRLRGSHTELFNPYDWNFEKGEFLLGVVWDINGFHFHMCCICDGLVFDGSLPYAVKIKPDIFDIICDSKFVKIRGGIYFHQRNNPPFPPVNKRKRNGNKNNTKIIHNTAG